MTRDDMRFLKYLYLHLTLFKAVFRTGKKYLITAPVRPCNLQREQLAIDQYKSCTCRNKTPPMFDLRNGSCRWTTLIVYIVYYEVRE